jgi:hypothetical protein
VVAFYPSLGNWDLDLVDTEGEVENPNIKGDLT